MRSRIELSPGAARQLRKLDAPGRSLVQAAVELLGKEPRPAGAKKLTGGSGEWRARTGGYRIVYEIDDGVLTVLVLAVGQRRDIHDRR